MHSTSHLASWFGSDERGPRPSGGAGLAGFFRLTLSFLPMLPVYGRAGHGQGPSSGQSEPLPLAALFPEPAPGGEAAESITRPVARTRTSQRGSTVSSSAMSSLPNGSAPNGRRPQSAGRLWRAPLGGVTWAVTAGQPAPPSNTAWRWHRVCQQSTCPMATRGRGRCCRLQPTRLRAKFCAGFREIGRKIEKTLSPARPGVATGAFTPTVPFARENEVGRV